MARRLGGFAQRGARQGFLLAWCGIIAFFTLRSVDPSPAWTEGQCCLVTDVVLNVALFVPFGIGLGLFAIRPMAAAGIGALCSAGIEIAQWWIPGRFSSAGDVATNTLGTLIGALLVAGWTSRRSWWRIVGPTSAVLVVLASVTASFLVRPATLEADTWWGQWAHQFAGTSRFEGQVLRFELQGMPIPDGPLLETPELNSRLVTEGKAVDRIELVAVIIPGPSAVGRVQLAGIVAGNPGHEYLGLWQEGRSLLGFVRLGLTDANLRTAWFRLEDALPRQAGDTISIAMRVTRRQVTLSARGRSTLERRYLLSPTLFWAGLIPHRTGAEGASAWSLLPLALAFLVVGAGVNGTGALLSLSAVTLYGSPLLAGTALAPWPAQAAAAVGAAAGWVLARRVGLRTKTPPRPRHFGA